MDLQISVFLLFVLFTAGHSLDCYEPTGPFSFWTGQPVKTCPSGSFHCESKTVVIQAGGMTSEVKTKDCVVACQSGFVNLGLKKMSSSCCNTDLCNAQDAPDPSNVPNGKTCYYCDFQNCSSTVRCSRNEDRCIKATGTFKGQSYVVKGCASKSICDTTASVPYVESISCCRGNMCNGAQSITQSFLFLCCSLLSYFLLH